MDPQMEGTMPEERKAIASPRGLPEGKVPSSATFRTDAVPNPLEDRQPGTLRPDEPRRAKTFRRLAFFLTIAAVLTIALYVWLYLQTGVWQLLVESGFLAVAIVLVIITMRMVRRGRFDAAGYLTLFGLAVAFCSNELVWDGVTLYIMVGGVLMALLAGSIVLPHKRSAGVVAALLSGIIIALLNWFQPLPRYDIAQSPVLSIFIPGLTASPVLATLWQIVRAIRIGTIRTRLLVAFVLVALLPTAIISTGAVAGEVQNDRQAIFNQLELLATLKATEINTWIHALQTDLATALIGENTMEHAHVLLQESSEAASYQDHHDALVDYFRLLIEQTQRFEELFLMDTNGITILSTDGAHEGQDHHYQVYFHQGLREPSVHSPSYSLPLGGMSIIAVHPVIDEQGQVQGILAGRASITTLSNFVRGQIELSGSEEIHLYLVSANYTLLTTSRAGETEEIPIDTLGTQAAIGNRTNGRGLYQDGQGVPVVGVYHWLPELQAALMVERDQSEAFRETYIALAANVGAALLGVLLAMTVSYFITRGITSSLAGLAKTAAQVAAGDLEHMAEVKRSDEVGVLAQSFNSMTAQLRDVISSLEQRVADRTQELERRSAYMETSAEVGSAVSSILDADQLIQQVVELIRDRFGLYYVGLFLADEANEWAVLQAGTGEAGRAMLARGHRLRVGQGMIGWCVANAQARIALHAEEDIVRTTTVELPDTRSEAALPLRSRGRVLGALTIQDDKPDAFDEDSIAVLQTMADQVAVALDNAHLFTESQEALEATRRVYSRLSQEAWGELLRARPDLGYRSSEGGIASVSDVWRADMERALLEGKTVQGNGALPPVLETTKGDVIEGTDGETKLPLVVPIKVRENVIGVLDTYRLASAGEWTPDEIALLETLADQLGMTLESARLYQDAQSRASRERLTREITDKMRSATSVEGIVQAAVDELFSILGTSRAFVRLGSPSPAQDTDKKEEHSRKDSRAQEDQVTQVAKR
jgi:GAF domain-containing protein/HAMP domain-containing protein